MLPTALDHVVVPGVVVGVLPLVYCALNHDTVSGPLEVFGAVIPDCGQKTLPLISNPSHLTKALVVELCFYAVLVIHLPLHHHGPSVLGVYWSTFNSKYTSFASAALLLCYPCCLCTPELPLQALCRAGHSRYAALVFYDTGRNVAGQVLPKRRLDKGLLELKLSYCFWCVPCSVTRRWVRWFWRPVSRLRPAHNCGSFKVNFDPIPVVY